jgi:hypothetical protein
LRVASRGAFERMICHYPIRMAIFFSDDNQVQAWLNVGGEVATKPALPPYQPLLATPTSLGISSTGPAITERSAASTFVRNFRKRRRHYPCLNAIAF